MDFTILHEIHHFVTVFLWFWGVTLTHHWFIDEVISDHVRNGRDGHVDVDSEEQNDFVNVLLSIEKSKTTGSTIDRTPIKL